jgi:integrase
MAIKRVFNKSKGRDQWVLNMRPQFSKRRIQMRFDSEKEAEQARDTINTDARRGALNLPTSRTKRTTISEYAATVVARLDVSSGHKSLTEKVFRHLCDMLGNDFLVADLTPIHFENYFTRRLQDNIKRSTIFLELAALKARLNTKIARSLFPDLKLWIRPDFPAIKSTIGRTRVITRDEENRILDELRKDDQGQAGNKRRLVADVFYLALRTGMRRSELLNLRWGNVHFEKSPGYPNGWLDVKGTKTKRSVRSVPLSPQAHKLLLTRKKQSRGSVVFPSTHHSNEDRPQQFIHQTLQQACERANIPYGHEHPDGLVFHDTRHTAITRMILEGYDLKTIGAIVGHSDTRMTMKYAHASIASKQAAVNALDDEPAENESRIHSVTKIAVTAGSNQL